MRMIVWYIYWGGGGTAFREVTPTADEISLIRDGRIICWEGLVFQWRFTEVGLSCASARLTAGKNNNPGTPDVSNNVVAPQPCKEETNLPVSIVPNLFASVTAFSPSMRTTSVPVPETWQPTTPSVTSDHSPETEVSSASDQLPERKDVNSSQSSWRHLSINRDLDWGLHTSFSSCQKDMRPFNDLFFFFFFFFDYSQWFSCYRSANSTMLCIQQAGVDGHGYTIMLFSRSQECFLLMLKFRRPEPFLCWRPL